jgi:hypothetical protein
VVGIDVADLVGVEHQTVLMRRLVGHAGRGIGGASGQRLHHRMDVVQAREERVRRVGVQEPDAVDVRVLLLARRVVADHVAERGLADVRVVRQR